MALFLSVGNNTSSKLLTLNKVVMIYNDCYNYIRNIINSPMTFIRIGKVINGKYKWGCRNEHIVS